MKSEKCIFSEKIKCVEHQMHGSQANHDKYYCRDCPHVPDLQNTRLGKHNLEYVMRIAISDHRKKNELPFLCKGGVDNIKNCPKWVYEIFDWPVCGNIPGHDHVRIFEKNGDFVITSEPYDMSMDRVKELTEFCEKRDLTFRMDGVSSHNPGHTFRIYIYNKGGNKAIGELISNYGR